MNCHSELSEEPFLYFTKILIQISRDSLMVSGVSKINTPMIIPKEIFKESSKITMAITKVAMANATVKA